MPCRPGSSKESMLKRHSRRRNLKTGDSRGQALVEFSLVVLAFMTIFVGLIEFGIAFSVEMQINFASRDVATLAAESGGSPTDRRLCHPHQDRPGHHGPGDPVQHN